VVEVLESDHASVLTDAEGGSYMSGQSAVLTLQEAKAMQERVQCGSNHSSTNGGGSSMKSGHTSKKKMGKDVVAMEKHED
jgi:hypothetical protein